MRNRILALTVASLALAAASCGGGECIPLDPGGETPKFIGAYEGVQTATVENCLGMQICEGPTTVGIFLDEQGQFVVGKTDCNGNYYELDGGQVCEPTSPGRYQVIGTHNVTEATADPKVTYTIALQLDETGDKPIISGTLTMSVIPSSGQACVLSGSITGTCVDCVP